MLLKKSVEKKELGKNVQLFLCQRGPPLLALWLVGASTLTSFLVAPPSDPVYCLIEFPQLASYRVLLVSVFESGSQNFLKSKNNKMKIFVKKIFKIRFIFCICFITVPIFWDQKPNLAIFQGRGVDLHVVNQDRAKTCIAMLEKRLLANKGPKSGSPSNPSIPQCCDIQGISDEPSIGCP